MTIIGAGKIKYFRHQRRPKHGKHKCYADRDKSIGYCGYASYVEYLNSEDWKQIRDKILTKHPRCVGCRGTAEQVHHLSYQYEVLLGMCSRGLASVCRNCHEAIEFDGKVKRDIYGANEALVAIAIKNGNDSWVKKYRGWEEHNRNEARARRRRQKGERKKQGKK